MKYILKHKINNENVVFGLYESSLLGKMKPCLIEDWIANEVCLESNKRVASSVISVLNELERSVGESRSGHEIYLSHKDVLRMSSSNLDALGLPPVVAQMNIESEGSITGDTFRLKIKYKKSNGEAIRASRSGAFFQISDKPCYRLSMELYEIVKITEKLNQAQNQDERLQAMSLLNRLIPNAENVQGNDDYLRELRIYHATAFSLDVIKSVGGISFTPVLFEKPVPMDTDDVLEVERSSMDGPNELLPPDYQSTFAKRFQKKSGRKTYLLENGVYIFCDEELKDALNIVSDVGHQNEDTKRNFIKNPRVFLRDKLASTYDEDKAEFMSNSLFVEYYEGYSDRVMDIGLWEPPVLPWIQKSGQNWVPDADSFGIKVRDDYIPIETHELSSLYDNLKDAQVNKREEIDFNGKKIPVDETLRALSGLPVEVNSLNIESGSDLESGSTLGSLSGNDRIVLLVRENFDEISYNEAPIRIRDISSSFVLPQTVRSIPKSYQREGIEWLQNSYKQGVSGVLLADDMGLGKTFQVLCFLSWLKSFRLQEPILVVAPTGLLKVWEDESEEHLRSPNLGDICRLYSSSGGKFRSFRSESSGNDLVYGRPTLDIDRIRKHGWVVVSYETMRDYEHSLGKIRFSCIVFDEIQKLKNPRSLLTKAAKALNGEFRIGMTGTPVENRLSDLHTISDVLRPGFLGSLKDFSSEYEKNPDRKKLHSLKQKIETSQVDVPAFMKRRLKQDVLQGDDFPQKKVEYYKEEMPLEQSDSYQKVLDEYKLSAGQKRGLMFQTIQRLRSISLHPYYPTQTHPDGDGVYGEDSGYFDLSARTKGALKILEEIKNKNEKAIIFLDSKKMQPLLKAEIAKRFGIRAPYIINGDCNVRNRKKAVDDFEGGEEGFDVIILSPKAAGFGITLTAANHVIHLSRWWNAAVEDQATDRVYRLGQKKDVYVHLPIAYSRLMSVEESFDSRLDILIDRKRNLSNELLAPVDGADSENHDLEFLINGVESDVFAGTDATLIDIDRMTPIEFEGWVCEQFVQADYEQASLTTSSHDQGVDICTEKNGRRVFVQVKHTFNVDCNCPSNPVLELKNAYDQYVGKADYFVITNHRGYNPQTEADGQSCGMILYVRSDLMNLSELLRSLVAH